MTEARTESRYTQKGGKYLSDELLSELKITMSTTKTLRSYELRYRANIEKYDIDWDEFIGKAKEGYFLSLMEADALPQDWQSKQRERLMSQQETDQAHEWVIVAHKLKGEIDNGRK